MGRGVTKVAVSIPDDLYQTIEKIRKIRRRSRSAVVQDARRPESRREVKAAEAAAVRLLSSDDW